MIYIGALTIDSSEHGTGVPEYCFRRSRYETASRYHKHDTRLTSDLDMKENHSVWGVQQVDSVQQNTFK